MARIDWTRIFVEAPGLRPTASEAVMPIKPTARAAPSAAKPTCMLPIISFILPFPAATAVEYVRAAKKFLLVGARRSFFLVLAHQQGEDRAQQHEDQRLHQAHQNFHEIKRNRQEPPEAGNHPGHGFQHGFAGIDVAVEPKTQCYRSKEN